MITCFIKASRSYVVKTEINLLGDVDWFTEKQHFYMKEIESLVKDSVKAKATAALNKKHKHRQIIVGARQRKDVPKPTIINGKELRIATLFEVNCSPTNVIYTNYTRKLKVPVCSEFEVLNEKLVIYALPQDEYKRTIKSDTVPRSKEQCSSHPLISEYFTKTASPIISDCIQRARLKALLKKSGKRKISETNAETPSHSLPADSSTKRTCFANIGQVSDNCVPSSHTNQAKCDLESANLFCSGIRSSGENPESKAKIRKPECTTTSLSDKPNQPYLRKDLNNRVLLSDSLDNRPTVIKTKSNISVSQRHREENMLNEKAKESSSTSDSNCEMECSKTKVGVCNRAGIGNKLHHTDKNKEPHFRSLPHKNIIAEKRQTTKDDLSKDISDGKTHLLTKQAGKLKAVSAPSKSSGVVPFDKSSTQRSKYGLDQSSSEDENFTVSLRGKRRKRTAAKTDTEPKTTDSKSHNPKSKKSMDIKQSQISTDLSGGKLAECNKASDVTVSSKKTEKVNHDSSKKFRRFSSVRELQKQCLSSEENTEESLEDPENILADCFILEQLSFTPSKWDRKLERDLEKVMNIRDLPDVQLKYLVMKNERYLRDIFQGKVHNRRHQDFKKGGKLRAQLMYQVNIGLFRDEQHDAVMHALLDMFCKRHNKYFDYVFRVMLPEILIKIYMDVHNVSYASTEQVLSIATKSENTALSHV